MSAWASMAPVAAAPLSAIIAEQKCHRMQERVDAAIAAELDASQRDADAAVAALVAATAVDEVEPAAVVIDDDDADEEEPFESVSNAERRLSTSSSTSSVDSSFDKLDDANEEFQRTLKEAHDEQALLEAALKAIELEEKDALLAAERQQESDAAIARALQKDFDRDHNDGLRQRERHENGQSKITVSYERHRTSGSGGELEEEDDEDEVEVDEPVDPMDAKYFDKFEQNSSLMASIPKRGYLTTSAGEKITKHDSHINGVRNAGRVMHLPPDVATGDTGASDIRLTNNVFNSMRLQLKHSQTAKHGRRSRAHDRREERRTGTGLCLDKQAMVCLSKQIDSGLLESVNHVVATGKEAIVIHAAGGHQPLPDGSLMPRECAVKMFRNSLRLFSNRCEYYGHQDEDTKLSTQQRIRDWTEREFSNLTRMWRSGVRCPAPALFKANYVVMQFVGEGAQQAPRLKQAKLTQRQAEQAYKDVCADMRRMYGGAKLVHADLSEYNVLWWREQCWIVDVAQAVDVTHESALEYLMRDCGNVNNFFRNLDGCLSDDELFSYVTDLDASTAADDATMLRRVQMRGPTCAQATAMAHRDDDDEDASLDGGYPFEYALGKANEAKEAADAAKQAEHAEQIEQQQQSTLIAATA